MRRAQRYSEVIAWFKANVPAPKSELHYDSPFQLLVAVVLSAQCTDKRVNMVTPALFEAYPDAFAMADASVEDIYGFIKSISYPNSKAAHLSALSRKLVADFGGRVPEDRDLLRTLPGVGLKTANVVTSIVFDNPVIAVDTHVFRVAHRLGLSDSKTPEKVSEELEKNIPAEDRATAHHWLILHGRYTCTARAPKCASCGLTAWCKYYSSTEPTGESLK